MPDRKAQIPTLATALERLTQTTPHFLRLTPLPFAPFHQYLEGISTASTYRQAGDSVKDKLNLQGLLTLNTDHHGPRQPERQGSRKEPAKAGRAGT